MAKSYRDSAEHVDVDFHENYWFAMLDHGIMPHPHHASQQWTVCVQHGNEEIDARLEAFKDVAPSLADRQE
jgi:glutamate-1-semialdehyde 2,1-aminomutase